MQITIDIDYTALHTLLNRPPTEAWAQQIPHYCAQGFNHQRYGDLAKWLDALTLLPAPPVQSVDLINSVQINGMQGAPDPLLAQHLQTLIPWRKGPFHLHGITVDTEWRSNLKWQRIQPHLDDLTGRCVLDIGCGNGYFLYRMLPYYPRLLLGIDPSPRFAVQFYMVKKLLRQAEAWAEVPIHLLPIGIEDAPLTPYFDTVLSLGVLYHRKMPLQHLAQCYALLRPGGQLVLETLVVKGRLLLMPISRYAAMPNVWFIPSLPLVQAWLKSTGFSNIQVVDVSITGEEEQRPTAWMPFQSLRHFIHGNHTIEGYPLPTRAVIFARK